MINSYAYNKYVYTSHLVHIYDHICVIRNYDDDDEEDEDEEEDEDNVYAYIFQT
jgi:hypothetical protein